MSQAHEATGSHHSLGDTQAHTHTHRHSHGHTYSHTQAHTATRIATQPHIHKSILPALFTRSNSTIVSRTSDFWRLS